MTYNDGVVAVDAGGRVALRTGRRDRVDPLGSDEVGAQGGREEDESEELHGKRGVWRWRARGST